jgi:hypothetical protein
MSREGGCRAWSARRAPAPLAPESRQPGLVALRVLRVRALPQPRGKRTALGALFVLGVVREELCVSVDE